MNANKNAKAQVARRVIRRILQKGTRRQQVNTRRIRKINKQLRRIARQNQKTNRTRARINMAIAKNFKRNINTLNIGATSARVSGRDLVYTIPDNHIVDQDQPLIALIPSNPAYWLGTRIATVAKGYQNYRPVKFNVHYVPHCAATQAGNVIAGTIFHEAPSITNLQQSLKTSNGGILTQVFKPATSVVKVGSNLQKNLYRVGGDIDDDSMPFYYLAIAIACKNTDGQSIVPGYFYVDYTYIFKNPIGSSVEFSNSGLSTFTDQLTTMKTQNIKLIITQPYISQTISLGVGTAIDVEYDIENQAYNFLYNNTPIDPPDAYVWVLSNEQNNSFTSSQMQARNKTAITFSLKFPNDPTDLYSIAPGSALLYAINNTIQSIVNQAVTPIYSQFDAAIKDLYYTADINQNFGILQPNASLKSSFIGNALNYYLKEVLVNQIIDLHPLKEQQLESYHHTKVLPYAYAFTHYTIKAPQNQQLEQSIHSANIQDLEDQVQQMHI